MLRASVCRRRRPTCLALAPVGVQCRPEMGEHEHQTRLYRWHTHGLFPPLLIATILLSVGWGPTDIYAQTPAPGRVRVLYLIPQDRAFRSDYSAAVRNAMVDLRGWYLRQLGDRTFSLFTPEPEVCRLPNPADYYYVNPWTKVLQDVQTCAPVSYNSPEFVWVLYVDVVHACDDPGRLGAGTSGITMMPRQDLEGLIGAPAVYECGTFVQPVFRWIGGAGHELGHAFRLPHPPGCDTGLPSCDYNALMWAGFYQYPATYLRADETQILRTSPFFPITPYTPCTVRSLTEATNPDGFSITGRLTGNDCEAPHRLGNRGHIYAFDGTVGETVKFHLARQPTSTPDFNPYLVLWRPDGTVLARADNPDYLCAPIQSTDDACLAYTLPTSGTYHIEVTSSTLLTLDASYWLFHYHTYPAGPTMSFDKRSLRFGAKMNLLDQFVAQTSAQVVRLTQSGPGSVPWTAASTAPWLTVSPQSGTGPANLTIAVRTANDVPLGGSATGSIVLTFIGAGNNPGPINVVLTTIAGGGIPSANPFGNVDTPANNRTGVTGAVPFTGWALDDIEVLRVSVCRAAVGAEVAPIDPNCGGAAQIFVGFGTFIDGARPDVAAAFPAFPVNTKAGWGFMVLTNTLPSQGNGTFVFHMWAQDREGHAVVLGTRTMTCANASSILPFGAIDTPTQGGVASGAGYAVFGWVLSRTARADPAGGGTVTVQVDGVTVGSPGGCGLAPNLTALFPGFPGLSTALGVFGLNTTLLSNGLHTIRWVATDNMGRTEGIGSRFFTVSNAAGALTAAATLERGASVRRQTLSRRPDANIEALSLDSTPILGRRGWDLGAELRAFEPGATGRTVIRSEEVSRVELQLGRAVRRLPAHESGTGRAAHRLDARRGYRRLHVGAWRRIRRRL